MRISGINDKLINFQNFGTNFGTNYRISKTENKTSFPIFGRLTMILENVERQYCIHIHTDEGSFLFDR